MISFLDEGFRLTYGGYDYLALHAFSLRGTVEALGRQIGVGKESDVYLVSGRAQSATEGDGSDNESVFDEDVPLETFVLKIERLGRTSFRSVKSNRDYMGNRKHVSWMYLSRLGAEKEWTFLKALHQHGFPTPRPIDWNRHCIVMSLVEGRPLEQIQWDDFEVDLSPTERIQVASYLFGMLMRLLVRIAEYGLVHGDFNEFNLLLTNAFLASPLSYLERAALEGDAEFDWQKDSPVIMIDFPQMVSTQHANAEELFGRDVECLRLFFSRRFHFEASEWPVLSRDVLVNGRTEGGLLDTELKASGFRNHHSDSSADEDESDNRDNSDSESDYNSESDSDDDVSECEEESLSEEAETETLSASSYEDSDSGFSSSSFDEEDFDTLLTLNR